MGKFYENSVAYMATQAAECNDSMLRQQLQNLGFTVSETASLDDLNRQFRVWLTAHGLDVTRADLGQQALINDHRKVVRAFIAESRRCVGKDPSQRYLTLQHSLQQDGITILDPTRLERCLAITAEKAKAAQKNRSKRAKAAQQFRTLRKTEAASMSRQVREEEFNSQWSELVELASKVVGPDDAEAVVNDRYAEVFRQEFDLSALAELFDEFEYELGQLIASATIAPAVG